MIPIMTELYLPVLVDVTQAPLPKAIMSVRPDDLDFGRQILDSTATLQITVTNTGNMTGYINDLQVRSNESSSQFEAAVVYPPIPPDESETS
jgi:hypothetical protein